MAWNEYIEVFEGVFSPVVINNNAEKGIGTERDGLDMLRKKGIYCILKVQTPSFFWEEII